VVLRATPDLYLAAAARLVNQSNPDIESAARGLVSAAPAHGIDLSLVWVTMNPPGPRRTAMRVRQASLAVPGDGRTAMLFVSEPAPGGDFGDPEESHRERVAVINQACQHLARHLHDRVCIAQALPDPAEAWAIAAFRSAGFIKVGDLAYMRRESKPAGKRSRGVEQAPLPAGVAVASLRELNLGPTAPELLEALEHTYLQTLDCPELCGLRETVDVVDSHRSTGAFDPALWWLVHLDGRPHGCALFNRCPEQRTIELVYLGLSPQLRGKGLGKWLLRQGIEAAREGNPGWAMTCAVDHRNTPALGLYRALGFRSFGDRTALVRPITRSLV